MSSLLPIIYLAFVSLGLPDSLLGSAWPSMHVTLGAQLASGGVVTMIVCGATIVSSLATDRLVRRLGTGRLTLLSVALTAASLLGFSTVDSFWQLCCWAVPYGLGAGAVDAALNAYVALHYEPRHMNWLHCCWGIGASVGPTIMGAAMAGGAGWQGGYRIVACVQAVFVIVLLCTLGRWGGDAAASSPGDDLPDRVPRSQLFKIPGVRQVLVAFLCYSALEASTGLWGATWLVSAHGMDSETAASMAALFYVGITAGRLLSGFLTLRLDGTTLLRVGEVTIALGTVMMMASPNAAVGGVGLVVVGLGCAPVYPQIIQLTPVRFGEGAASSLMGVQMAFAYVGSTFAPSLVGLLIQNVAPQTLPWFVAAVLVVMTCCQEAATRLARGRGQGTND